MASCSAARTWWDAANACGDAPWWRHAQTDLLSLTPPWGSSGRDGRHSPDAVDKLAQRRCRGSRDRRPLRRATPSTSASSSRAAAAPSARSQSRGGHIALGLPHPTLGAVGGGDLDGMRLIVASGEAGGLARRGVVGVDASATIAGVASPAIMGSLQFGHGRCSANPANRATCLPRPPVSYVRIAHLDAGHKP